MKFKPEDFQSVVAKYHGTLHSYDTFERKISERANALLEKWLDEADIASGSEAKRLAVVFKARYLELKKEIEEAPEVFAIHNEFGIFASSQPQEGDMYRAKLVRIEELKDDS